MKVRQNFDSTEEYWIYLYLLELQEAEYIKSFECQPRSFELFKGLPKKFYILKQLKTKISKKYSKKQHLINPHLYTADFSIIWNLEKIKNILCQDINNIEFKKDIPFFSEIFPDPDNMVYNGISYFEVKAKFDRNNATRLFTSRTQPWIWQKFRIYIQLIIPEILFKQTFIPKELLPEFYYKKNGKGYKKGDKKFKWDYKSLKEYINEQNNK